MKVAHFLTGATIVVLAACTSPAVSDDQKRPKDAQTGMSIQQVERLMGSPATACWQYTRGHRDYDRICFTNALVDTITKVTPMPGTRDIYIDSAFAGTAIPKTPSPSAAEVGFWMRPAQVTRLKGKPSSIEAYYAKGKAEYYAKFNNGVLVEFVPTVIECVHGLCTRVHSNDAFQ